MTRTTRPRRADAVPGTEVRTSSIHGRGLFAARAFRRGDVIGVFEGVRTRRAGPHVLWLDEREGVRGTNDLRYVNHAARPNAAFDGVELVALRAIPAGSEITHDYGPDWDDLRDDS